MQKDKKRSKSFYYKVFRNSLLILLIPILVIVMMYLETEKLVKEQIQISSNKVLNQFFRSVDLALEEMNDFCINVAFNKEVVNYATYSVYYEKKKTYQLFVLGNEFKSMDVGRYKDAYIYYPYDNRVVSAFNGSVSEDYYYKLYYDNGTETQREQFQKMLECDSKKPKLYAVNGAEGEVYLAVAMRKTHYRDPRQEYVVAVMLSPKYLAELMVSEDAPYKDSIMIFGENKELLFSSDIEDVRLSDEMIKNEHTNHVTIGDASYMLQIKQSDVLGGYYAVATPYEYFWQRLVIIRSIFIIGLLAVGFLGIMVSYRMSLNVYMPLRELIKQLQRKTNTKFDRQNVTEFEFIEEAFYKEKQKVKQSQAAVLERFVIALLEGNVQEQEGDDIFQKNGMQLFSDRFFVAVVTVDKSDLGQLDYFVLQNVFNELFDANHKGYLVRASEKRYAVLVNLRAVENVDALIDVLNIGKAFLKEKCGMELSIGAGNMIEGMMQIPNSYKEALQAIRYSYLYGKEELIEYRKIDKKEFQYPVSSESRIYMLLTGYIGSTDNKTGNQFMKSLLELYGIDKNTSMEAVDCFQAEIKSAMNIILATQNYNLADKFSKFDEVMKADTLTGFTENFVSFLDTLRRLEQEKEGRGDICSRAKDYINACYGDNDLALATVAYKLHISAPYLSKLFKESYDVSVPDYIAQIRLKNAKDMLKDSRKNINEIAEDCGFRTGSIFIKTFKKWEGITPGVYKSLLEK